jgi:minor extracellular serine protease Vpr
MNQFALRTLCAMAAAVLAACGGGKTDDGAADGRAQVSSASTGATGTLMPGLVAAPAGATASRIDYRLRARQGELDVWVQLDKASLASTRAKLAATTGVARVRGAQDAASVRSAMAAQRASIAAQQQEIATRLTGLGARELGRAKVAHNAIAVRVDATQLASIAALPGVVRVQPVVNYEIDLSETVPYIGASAVQTAGFDGTGVKVAVLDSGIDYTHKNLGGSGSAADFQAAQAAAAGPAPAALFPSAKVVGGYDFVGETWPNTPTAPDPNPIDAGTGAGHGTHVADIIAGRSLDGTRKGVAPGATLLAVKVCSSVSSSCNGVALLQGMDYALDPNGDGDIADAADVINLSLGSGYGQIEDDLTQAVSNAVDFGVVVVASAGNSADRPFITGSPSIAPGAIGVAQTQVPSALAFPLTVTGITPSVIANTATVDWAPIGSGFSGEVVRLGRACPAGSISTGSAADPYFNGNSPSGKVALIDRGSCSVSLKVDRATKDGAIAVIIANNASGDPPSFSFGGGDLPMAPTLVISLADGNRIKTALGASGLNPAVVASISPAVTVPLVGSMVASSSRGPSFSLQTIKPEIGAPGASISAIYGTGDGQGAFGGTSGAAPMVAGSAALLVQANPRRSPIEIKAMLMNSAETAVYTNPATQPGVLAPITRIGAGEVRVDRALAMGTIAYDRAAQSAALSFGVVEADGLHTVKRRLTVQNLGNTAKTFTVTPGFRYASDAASTAVTPIAPSTVTVNAGGTTVIEVALAIDGSKLPNWTLNGGSGGGNGATLNGVEFDGYLTLASGSETLTVPWHVLPRKAANTRVVPGSANNGNSFTLANTGINAGAYEVFSLTGSSPRFPSSQLPGPGDNFAIIDLQSVGVRYLDATACGLVGGCLQFAVSTYGRRAHPNYPAVFEIGVDTNGDGAPDFYVFNQELTGFAATGQNVVYVQSAAPGSAASAFFFTDADLVSGNAVLTVPMGAMGLTPGQPFGFYAMAADNYFTGAVTDFIDGMKFTPGASAFSAPLAGSVAPATSVRVPFTRTAVPAGSSTEAGLLVLHRRNAGAESNEVRVR